MIKRPTRVFTAQDPLIVSILFSRQMELPLFTENQLFHNCAIVVVIFIVIIVTIIIITIRV
jgi:hypothetical protein